MDAIEKGWLTFIIAIVVIVSAVALRYSGKINNDVYQWQVLAGIGAYTARTITKKITDIKKTCNKAG